jgi:hypothetical protein
VRITFFPNGTNTAFENDEQVPAAQRPWLLVFAEYLVSQGIDPTAQEFVMPDGNGAKIFVFKDEDGEVSYNWGLIR